MSNEITPFGLVSTTNQFWNITVNNENGNLEFNANRNDSGGGDLRLVINDDNGNVGIGTSEPKHKLHVKDGSIEVSDSAYLGTPGSTPYAYINKGRYAVYSYSDGTALYGRSNSVSPTLALWNMAGGHDISSYGQKNYFKGNIGIGTDNAGADKLDVRGRCYSSGGWHTTNQDYAEYFESYNGSAIPAGTAVTLVTNGKVAPSKNGDTPIGIVATNSAVVGNSYKEWPKKYLRDDFGNFIMEKYEKEVLVPKKEKVKKERQKVRKKIIETENVRIEVVLKNGKFHRVKLKEQVSNEVKEPVFEEVDLYNEKGDQIIGKYKAPLMESYEEEIEVLDDRGDPIMVGSGRFEKKERPKINPDYDEKKKYIPRENRSEWNCVGLLGKLPLRKGQPVAKSWVKIKDLSDDVELWLVK